MKEGLKIIAIRPLDNCDSNYSKVSKKGQVYTFYNEYKIDTEKDTITYTESVPDGLYDVNNIKVSISAIVGKNGEGKSTLVELLFMAINNISHKAKNIRPAKIKTVQLNYVRKLHVELYFVLYGELYKFQIKDVNLKVFVYTKTDNIYEKPIDTPFEDFNLNHFFYTIGTNYSHYALNSKDYGMWIHSLFHKNDAYQTPIVINPFRKDGNIDINNENFLVKSRLLSLMLSAEVDYIHLTDKQKVTGIEFKFNKAKFDYVYKLYRKDKEYKINESDFKLKNTNYNKYEIVNLLFKKFGFEYLSLRNIPVDDIENSIIKYTEDYIFKKLINISITYDHYASYFNKETEEFCDLNSNNVFNSKSLQRYINQLYKDKSHITLKLRQAIYFIAYNIYSDFEDIVKLGKKNYTIDSLIDKIENKAKKYDKEIIELLPPSFLEPDIRLDVVNSDSKPEGIIMFSSLSSGEKQLIFTVSSIIYHIKNLISVDDVNSKLVRYNNFNLIFEEIELYFHPDLQRKFINQLLGNLQKMPNNKIDSINVCFVTHSPFILSDIPSQNIVFLKVKKEDNLSYPQTETMATFGGNIHDILKNSFFLENGSMGEKAETIINQTIDFLRLNYLERELKNDTSIDESLERKEDYKKLKEKVTNLNFDYHYKVINMIDEPILKSKLMEMYQEICSKDEQLKLIRRQIEYLQQIEKDIIK